MAEALVKPADAARAIPRGPTAVGPLRHGQETYANPFLAWPAGRIVQLCPGQALLPGAIWGKGPTKGRGKKRPVALAHNGANGNNKQRPAGQQPFGGPGRHVWPCKTGRAEPPNGILWWQWCVERGMSVLCLPDAHRPFPQPFSVPMMPCSLSPPSAGTVPFSVMPHDSYDCTMIGFCPLNPFGVATWQYVRKTCCKMASCHFAFTLGYAILLDYRNVLLQMSVTLDNVCPKKRANRWLCAAFSIK